MSSKFMWKNLYLSIALCDGWYGISIVLSPFDWKLTVDTEDGLDIQVGPLFVRMIWKDL
jgi:hypothetical protein